MDDSVQRWLTQNRGTCGQPKNGRLLNPRLADSRLLHIVFGIQSGTDANRSAPLDASKPHDFSKLSLEDRST
jgi:hypothetical protein